MAEAIFHSIEDMAPYARDVIEDYYGNHRQPLERARWVVCVEVLARMVLERAAWDEHEAADAQATKLNMIFAEIADANETSEIEHELSCDEPDPFAHLSRWVDERNGGDLP